MGFIPNHIPFDGVEVSKHMSYQTAKTKFSSIGVLTVIQSGDAHQLEEILGLNMLSIMRPSFEEIKMALAGCNDRSLQIMEFHQRL